MANATGKPNIVLILTDHFRPDAVGRSTPNLMKLAERGAMFTNAYCASPLCQPARVSIVTGLYPSQHGACGNMAEPISDGLRDDTYMHQLRSAGYYSALIGKHHYIDRYGLGFDALDDDEEIARYGYDHVFQVLSEAIGASYDNDCRYTHYLREKGVFEECRKAFAAGAWACKDFPFPEEDFDDAFIGRTGCEFIRNCEDSRPLYLNLSFVGPHPPYWHPDGLQHDPAAMPKPMGVPDSEWTRQRRAHYMDRCSLIDRHVGQLVETLEEQDMLDDTVIIFTSDHGDNLGDYGIWDKRFFYEQSVGVPLIMCGPGVPRGARDLTGKLSKALVSHLDLYPTILNMAGADPASYESRPGLDVLAMLREERASFRREVCAELGTAMMIRTASWKLVFDPEQGGVQQLFNLATDPTEEHNLAGAAGYERVVGDLTQDMLAHRIRLTQYTHDKEECRVQRVRIGPTV